MVWSSKRKRCTIKVLKKFQALHSMHFYLALNPESTKGFRPKKVKVWTSLNGYHFGWRAYISSSASSWLGSLIYKCQSALSPRPCFIFHQKNKKKELALYGYTGLCKWLKISLEQLLWSHATINYTIVSMWTLSLSNLFILITNMGSCGVELTSKLTPNYMGNYMYHSHSHSHYHFHSHSYIFIRKNYQWDVTFTRLFFLTRNRKRKKKIPWWNWVFHLYTLTFIISFIYIYIYIHIYIPTLLCLKDFLKWMNSKTNSNSLGLLRRYQNYQRKKTRREPK